MTSEYYDNQNYNQFFNNQKISNVDILNNFLLSTGERIDSETFKNIMENYDSEEYKKTAGKFNEQIKTIVREEYKKKSLPIIGKVTKIYPDGYVDVQRIQGEKTECWTHIPNPTIFQYLEIGDEVMLGYCDGEQKSNCWVMFAKLSPTDFKTKTIYKDIENLKIIHNNTKFLQKWLRHLGLIGGIKNVYSE